nr:ribonuclease H-like domain-containing protein [Tanacetum cinerariifolium]
MQKKKNDVKSRTTLLLSLPDEHQLRFSKYKTARELWAAILKTFGGNEATKKTKKNLLNQASKNQDRGRRDNYRQGSKAKEHAPKALMAIDGVGWDWKDLALVADEVAPTEFALMANTCAESKKLETLKVEKEGVDEKLAGLLKASKDLDNLIESQRSDKNKDGLGYSVVPPLPAQLYLSPKKDLSWTGLPECVDCNTPKLDRSGILGPGPKHSSGNEDGNTACIPTASTNVPTASASIDEDNMEEMDIKWNMALLSMRADKFWKKTGKKINIQGSDVAGFDKSKVECFNCHKMGHL